MCSALHVIENQLLRAVVAERGAELQSVVRKCDGVEHIWQADASVWGWHAPILFPHCGRVVDDRIEAKGAICESPIHGFAREARHRLASRTDSSVSLVMTSSPETLARFPYELSLTSRFELDGGALLHTLTVENADRASMPFGIGYHPGFRVPFDVEHTLSDYELRFSDVESPLCLDTRPHGLMSGRAYRLATNVRSLPIDGDLFADGGHCMVGLRSSTLGIFERGSSRAVVCDISSFPYVLIWSKPNVPGFVCVEPWHSLPSDEDSSIRWEDKPSAAVLERGESWSCTLKTTFAR